MEKIETRLRKIFVTKEEFFQLVTRVGGIAEDVGILKENIILVISGIDGILKGFAEFRLELASLKVSDDRQNKHIKQLAEKAETILTE